MSLLLYLIADIALAAPLASAAGPFRALADYCQKARTEVCREVRRTDQVPIPAVTGAAAPFRAITVLQVGSSSQGDYRLAVRTDAGWFVDEDWPLAYESRGRYHGRVNSLTMVQTPLGPLLVTRTTDAFWRKPLTDAEMRANDRDGDSYYLIGRMTVCGLGKTLSCTRPFAVAAALDEPDEYADAYRFDAWLHAKWELGARFDSDGITLDPLGKRGPPNVWGMPKGVLDFIEEAKHLPGHHALHFP